MFKKILMTAMVVASAAFAQIGVGVHAAGTVSNLYGDQAEKVTAGVGFSAGIGAKISLPLLPITIAPEVLIDMRNTGIDGMDDYSMTEWALDIPVMVRFSLLPILYVEAGPSFNFNLATGTHDVIAKRDVDTDIPGESLNSFEFGLAFGVGTGIVPFLDIDFRVNLGLTNTFSDKYSVAGITIGTGKEPDMSNLQFALGVTYWFL